VLILETPCNHKRFRLRVTAHCLILSLVLERRGGVAVPHRTRALAAQHGVARRQHRFSLICSSLLMLAARIANFPLHFHNPEESVSPELSFAIGTAPSSCQVPTHAHLSQHALPARSFSQIVQTHESVVVSATASCFITAPPDQPPSTHIPSKQLSCV